MYESPRHAIDISFQCAKSLHWCSGGGIGKFDKRFVRDKTFSRNAVNPYFEAYAGAGRCHFGRGIDHWGFLDW
jgi:hypothetical protein